MSGMSDDPRNGGIRKYDQTGFNGELESTESTDITGAPVENAPSQKENIFDLLHAHSGGSKRGAPHHVHGAGHN